MVGARLINITDSQVTFHCLTNGRSPFAKLNRLVRGIAAVSLQRISPSSASGPSASGILRTTGAASSRPLDCKKATLKNPWGWGDGRFSYTGEEFHSFLISRIHASANSCHLCWAGLFKAEYINHLFQEGEAISRAGWLLSGMRRFYPRVRKELCLAQHWYTIWTHPSGSNALEGAPCPCRAMLEGKMVAFIRLMPSVRFRFLFAYPRGAVPQSWRHWGQPGHGLSKQHLQTLTLEHPKVANLTAIALAGLSSPGCGHGHPAFFGIVSLPFAISSFFPPWRGGATHFCMVLKSLDFVMVQGHWKDRRTCRLYLDDARAMLVNFSLPDEAVKLLRTFRSFLWQIATQMGQKRAGCVFSSFIFFCLGVGQVVAVTALHLTRVATCGCVSSGACGYSCVNFAAAPQPRTPAGLCGNKPCATWCINYFINILCIYINILYIYIYCIYRYIYYIYIYRYIFILMQHGTWEQKCQAKEPLPGKRRTKSPKMVTGKEMAMKMPRRDLVLKCTEVLVYWFLGFF